MKKQRITLRQVFEHYQQDRPELTTASIRNYTTRLKYLDDWMDIPLTHINKDMIVQRHKSITDANGANKKATANSVMRTFRTLWNYAQARYDNEKIEANPTLRLKQLRLWHRDRKRKTIIENNQLPAWFRGVFALDNPTMRDFLLLLMFTGMRKEEGLGLTWDAVDLDAGIITLKITKNKEENVKIPLSDYAWQVMRLRFYGRKESRYVFPGRYDNDKPFSAGNIEDVTEVSGVSFCLHDLRRTFLTIGDDLDLKSEVLKQLVNHQQRDITEGYIFRSPERLRRASQQITNQILKLSGLDATKGGMRA